MFRYINTVVFEHMNLGTSTISTLTRFQLDSQTKLQIAVHS